MSKRANPFLEDFVPQRKVHYGVKQYNNSEERLQKVYEKTLQLLFKGAKKQPVQDASLTTSDIKCDSKIDNMKQLLIGKDGNLDHSGILVTDKHVSRQQCVCRKLQTGSTCAYCEMKLCACNQHVCARCELCYCSNCLIIGSEGADVCMSCYG